MSTDAQDARIEQRQSLRLELREHRLELAHRLGSGGGVPGDYPRSVTMRFVTQHPEVAMRILTGVARWFRR